MSIPSYVASACLSINEELFDSLSEISSGILFIRTFVDAANSIIDQIIGIPATDLNIVLNQVSTLENDMLNAIPNLDGINNNYIQDVLNNCAFFGYYISTYGLQTMIKKTFELFDDLLSVIFSTLASIFQGLEYLIATSIYYIKKYFDKFNISSFVNRFDKFINCASIVCGENVDPIINQFNEIIDGIPLTSEGAFDVETFLGQTALTNDQIININLYHNKMQSVYNSAISQIRKDIQTFNDDMQNIIVEREKTGQNFFIEAGMVNTEDREDIPLSSLLNRNILPPTKIPSETNTPKNQSEYINPDNKPQEIDYSVEKEYYFT